MVCDRIHTRCPACHFSTIVVNNGRLLCTWHECPDPTLIHRLGEDVSESEIKAREAIAVAMESSRLSEAKLAIQAGLAVRASSYWENRLVMPPPPSPPPPRGG